MAKPIVDGIENDLEGQAQVIRLNVMSDVGSRAAQRYGVRGVPTVLIFDGNGYLVDQSVGVPSRKFVVAQVLELAE
jgi:thioredoxin-like negative regulator of GroEL